MDLELHLSVAALLASAGVICFGMAAALWVARRLPRWIWQAMASDWGK